MNAKASQAIRGGTVQRNDEACDHLFISYAWEDHAFAKWLALKLTAEGYKVWIDQFKLLGGESWPSDIDDAIKRRTFRMLGLLSRHSIAKPNPVKERTLALNIDKQPGRAGFLIPLNVDGIPPVELDWLTSDITFVPFSSSWSHGLTQLLKLLERENCPRTAGDGRAIVSRLVASSDLVCERPETLTSNRCPFIKVPDCITAYRVSPQLSFGDAALRGALRDWSCYSVSPHRVLAFHPPGDGLAAWLRTEIAQEYAWREREDLEGVDARNVVVRLLRGCVETCLRRAGFEWSAGAEGYVFPGPHGESLRVRLPSGAMTTVQHSGERTFFRVGQPKVRYRYRLAIRLVIDRAGEDEFALIWRLRFHLTDTSNEPLPSSMNQSRRKHLTRDWHNYHWLVRHLAAVQRCADDDHVIRVGPDGDAQVVLDCRLESFEVPVSIDEEKLTAAREMRDEEADLIPVANEPGLQEVRSEEGDDE